MTAIRLIPCLDIRDGRVVKGTHFVDLRDAGDPVSLGKFYAEQGADELVFLDITASHEERPAVIDLAERVSEEIFIPFTVGGGLRTVEDIRRALRAGADKVSLNSAALANPELIREAAYHGGAQCVVVAIDAKRSGEAWRVYSHGGRTDTGRDVLDWALEAAELGAGEILLTSMDGDGTRAGYDLELTRTVSEALSIPVIASGGAGNASHMVDAVRIGKADAVLLAGILHDGIATIGSLKEEMSGAGLEIRPHKARMA